MIRYAVLPPAVAALCALAGAGVFAADPELDARLKGGNVMAADAYEVSGKVLVLRGKGGRELLTMESE